MRQTAFMYEGILGRKSSPCSGLLLYYYYNLTQAGFILNTTKYFYYGHSNV